jgi:hypothetical protein
MKTSVAFAVMILILVACVPSPSMATALPATTPTATIEWTAEPTIFFPVTEAVPSPTPTPDPYHGHLQFPFIDADAGNFALRTGQTITFIWVEAPPDAKYYEFVLYPLDGSAPIPLGTDNDSSDGVSLEWIVVPDVAAELRASAYYGSDQPVLKAVVPTIYSPSVSQ